MQIGLIDGCTESAFVSYLFCFFTPSYFLLLQLLYLVFFFSVLFFLCALSYQGFYFVDILAHKASRLFFHVLFRLT